MPKKIAIGLLLLAGCEAFPALDSTVTDAARAAPFPALINLNELRNQSNTSSQESAAIIDDLNGRVARLNARAAGLKRPVIDQTTRSRMLRGVR